MALVLDRIALPLRAFTVGLTLEVDGTVALVGPSWAGKTTVLRCLLGLLPFEGDLRVMGQPCASPRLRDGAGLNFVHISSR